MKRIFMIMMLSVFALVSCEGTDEGTTGGGSATGAAVNLDLLNADPYSVLGPDAVYTVVYEGTLEGNSGTVTLSAVSCKLELEPDTYKLHVYNKANNISVEANAEGDYIASATTTDGQLGTLYYAYVEGVVAERGSTKLQSVDFSLITGGFDFTYAWGSGDTGSISSIDASITGVATKWNCTDKVVLETGEIDVALSATSYEYSFNLLGVSDLAVEFTYYYNGDATLNGNLDLTDALDGFNTLKDNDYNYVGTLNAPQTGTAGGDITDRDDTNIESEI